MNINVRVLSAHARAEIARLRAQVAQLEGQLAAAGAAGGADPFGAKRSKKSLAALGNQIQWTGRQLQYNWTIPLAIAAAAATKFALDNEKAMTRVAKVYGDVEAAGAYFNKQMGLNAKAQEGQAKAARVFEQELRALDKAFTALSNRYGTAKKEVTEVAAAWAAAGVSGIDLAKATNLSIRASILGDMQLEKSTKSMIQLQAQYGLSIGETRKALDLLNAVENATAANLSDLIEGFTRSAGTAREAGVDIRHLAAMLAALTPASGTASTAGNGLKTIISRLLSPTQDAAQLLDIMGISVSDMSWKALTATERLELMADKFDSTMRKAADGSYILSDAQKVQAATVLGSRWQLSRFLTLMQAINDENSYYYKALHATTSKQKAFNSAQKELDALLSSNPQRLKILWSTIQNGMADAIQPMIPYMIWAAQAVANLVRQFGELDPAMQKTALIAAFMLAAVGPVVKYFGSLLTLIGTLAVPFKLLGAGMAGIFTVTRNVNGEMVKTRLSILGLAGSMISIPFSFLLAGFGKLLALLIAAPRALLLAWTSVRTIAIIWSGTFGIVTALTRSAVSKISLMMALGAAAGVSTWTKMFAGLRIIFTTGWAALALITRSGITTVTMLMTRGLVTGLAAAGTALIAAITSPIGLALTGIALLILVFQKQIAALWGRIVAYFSDSSNEMVAFVLRAWNALPQGVANALTAVARVVQTIALQIYEWFSYINPWARHSPSLVENVTTGMAEVSRQFAKARSNIGVHVKGAYGDIKRFGNAVANLLKRSENMEIKQDRKKLAKAAPGSLKEFDALTRRLKQLRRDLDYLQAKMDKQQAVVDSWTAKVDKANAKLKKQQDILDKLTATQDKWQRKLESAQDALSYYASAPLVGMREMNDAIFDNELAQKRLRYEMMKIEEVSGSLDDIKSKIEAINGAQELLRGEQAALRSAGAGGEILRHYDDQIAALEATKDAQNDAAESINELQKQLDELQRRGEMLDLEKALKFDELTYAIEKAADTAKELTFEEIIAGVRKARADMARYEEKLKTASNAVEKQQKVVDRLTAARDRLQARLDREQAILDKIKSKYDKVSDAISKIEDIIQRATSAIEAMGSKGAAAADKLGKAGAKLKGVGKKGAGALGGSDAISPAVQNFLDAEGGNFAKAGGAGLSSRMGKDWESQVKQINKFTEQMTQEAANAFKDINPFTPLKEKWQNFKAWIKGSWGDFKSAAGSMFADLFPASAGGSGNPFQNLVEKFRVGWARVKDWFLKNIWGPITKIWSLFWPSIKRYIDNARKGFSDMFGQISPELKNLWKTVKRIGPAFKGLWNILKPILAVIGGIVGLISKVVINIAANVVRSILKMIGGFIAGVIRIVNGVIQIVSGFFKLFTKGGFKKGLAEMWEGVKNIFGGGLDAVWAVLKGAFGSIVGAFLGIMQGLWEAAVWLWDELVGHSIIPDLVRDIKKWFNKLADIAVWVWENVAKPVIKVFKTVFKRVIDGLKVWWAAVKGAWRVLKAAAKWWWNNVLKPLYDEVKRIWDNHVKPFLASWWDKAKAAWNKLKAAAKWWWENVLIPTYNELKRWWQEKVKPYLAALWDKWKEAWGPLVKAANWLWDNVLKPAYDEIKRWWEEKAEPFLEKVPGKWKKDWDELKGLAGWLRDWVLNPIWQGLKFWWKSKIHKHLTSHFEKWKKGWENLKAVAKWLWHNVLYPAWVMLVKLWNWAKNELEKWWNRWKNRWEMLKALGKWIWNNVLLPAYNRIKELWNKTRDQLKQWKQRWTTAWENLKSIKDWIKSNVTDPIYNRMTGVWTDIKNWFTKNKNLLARPAKDLANEVIKAVNGVIGGINRVGNLLPGTNWHVNEINLLAKGGPIPERRVGAGFKTNGARAIVGEGKANHPEFVIPTDPTYRRRAVSLLGAAASKLGITPGGDKSDVDHAIAPAGQFYGGVPAYSIGGWLRDKWGAAKDMGNKLMEQWLKIKKNAVSGIMTPAIALARRKLADDWYAPREVGLYALSKIVPWAKDTNSTANSYIEAAKKKKKEEGSVKGGGAALKWARSQAGKPYIWSGVGPAGYDCSGFMSAITNVLRGKNPHSRVGSTGSFPWAGFKPGAAPKGFTIGSTTSYAGGIGHMAGTLNGVNVESSGGVGVRVGGGARGYNDPNFNKIYHLAQGAIVKAQRKGVLANIGEGGHDEAVVPLPKGWRNGELIGGQPVEKHYHFHGDLSFPSIKSGDDAKTFLDNLENLSRD